MKFESVRLPEDECCWRMSLVEIDDAGAAFAESFFWMNALRFSRLSTCSCFPCIHTLKHNA